MYGINNMEDHIIKNIKYIIRHQDKNGKEDLLKAIHFIEMIIERDYK